MSTTAPGNAEPQLGAKTPHAKLGLGVPSVPPGYKQTEVGVIPEDWDVRLLSEHFRIYAGGDVPKHSLSDIRSELHPYPIFANSLQEKGLYGFTGERRAKGGSLTITGRGYLGHAVYRDEDFFPIVRLLVLEPISQLDASFTTFAVNERVKFAFESTGVPQLTAPQVGRYSVAAPSLPEQRAIATALSDVDALLAALDRLIAKQRDLKQAAMQQLLTGQTRLPGFTGKWETKTLGEITDSLDNLRVPLNESQRERMKGDYPYCGANGVLGFVDNYVVDDDIILMAEDGGYFDEYETRPIAYRMTGKCWVNNHAHILKAKPGSDQGYLFYSLVHKNILPFLASGTRAKLNKSEMNKIEIRRPKDLPEQTTIATVLSDMDLELAALEQRRDKTRALKQGMMQELLTGRTRLRPGNAEPQLGASMKSK